MHLHQSKIILSVFQVKNIDFFYVIKNGWKKNKFIKHLDFQKKKYQPLLFKMNQKTSFTEPQDCTTSQDNKCHVSCINQIERKTKSDHNRLFSSFL